MIRFISTFIITSVALSALAFVGINIDLSLNSSWINEAASKFEWWNIFTTEHAITMIYIRGSWWLLPPCFMGLCVAIGSLFKEK